MLRESLHKFRNRPPLTKKQSICKFIALLTLFVVIGLDILTKVIVVENMSLGEEIPVLDGVLHWKYIHNPGAAFGMLSNSRAVFLVISVVAIIVLAVYIIFTRSDNLLWMAAVGMLIGGGIGNMIDRIALGFVIDFIYVALIDFAVFNVADCFVCIGVGLMLLLTLLDMIREIKLEKQKKRDSAALADEDTSPSALDAAVENPEITNRTEDENHDE